MLTIVGEDKPGIVAKITYTLYSNNCNLGEASMNRLGGNFTTMLMISSNDDKTKLHDLLAPICETLNLRFHIDDIQGKLHDHHVPTTLITVSGADRSGIVSQVTNTLFENGLDILNLSSDVAGTESKPIYIMQIEGVTNKETSDLERALQPLKENNIDVSVQSIDTLVG